MGRDPSIQKDIKPDPADLLARAELQFQMSREMVTAFLPQRQESERAIQELIDSNTELAKALRLMARDNSQYEDFGLIPSLESSEMKLCLSLVPSYRLATGEYFEQMEGKVLVELAKAYIRGDSKVTLSELVGATGYATATVRSVISSLKNYLLGPDCEFGTDTGRTYEIRKVARDKWALVKLEVRHSC